MFKSSDYKVKSPTEYNLSEVNSLLKILLHFTDSQAPGMTVERCTFQRMFCSKDHVGGGRPNCTASLQFA